jgi:two-component system LytT family response regulator
VIRTLIVDDEPLARRAMRMRLGREPDIEVVGEACDGHGAVETIRRLRPDLVFLDVQMPGLDGFGVLEQVADEHLPMVVFVTASDVHALRAFEIHALDYLLKPFSSARFDAALRRARLEIASGATFPERAKLAGLLESLTAERSHNGARAYAHRLAVREGDRITMVRVDDLDAIEAAGNYVMLVERSRRHLVRRTLSALESQLDPARFARIHRSTIVNVDRIREIHLESHGDCDVVMESGAAYRLSRNYRDRLLPGRSGAIR